MAITIVCGAQVGTCLTAVLASLSGSNKGKRAAMIHLFYNLIRNTLFLVIFYILAGMLNFAFMGNVAGAVGIAAFHTLINLLGSAVFLPISRLLVKLVHMVLPFSAAEKEEEADTLTILDPLFLRNPAFAIDQVRTASFMLADVVQEYYDLYLDMIDKNLPEQSEDMRLTGVKAERYVSQLRKYCIRLSEHKMHDQEARNLAYLSSAVNNFAEMAEKIKGMTESFIGLKKSGESFSQGAKKDIATFGSAVQEILEATVHDYATQNTRLASTVQIYREIITDMHGKISKRNVRRLHSGECGQDNNHVFSDLCAGYERIVDRCDSIASHILTAAREQVRTPSQEQYDAIMALFVDKFEELDS
jgi:phosphate:Na+ symporter